MSRPLVVLGDGPVPIQTDPRTLSGLLGEAEPDVLAGWSPGRQPWLEAWLAGSAEHPGPRLQTVMSGYALADAINAGTAQYVPVRLSTLDRHIERLQPDLAVLPAVPRGRGFALRGSVGWQLSAVRHARRLVLELDASAVDVGLPAIEGEIVAVREVGCTSDVYSGKPPADADLAIGRFAAALIPDGATVQLGLGSIGEAIIAAIDKPVRVHSGLVCDSLLDLAERGLLSGVAHASYDWGGAATTQLLLDGALTLGPITETNHPGIVGRIPRFVGFNTALQVGLDGSVNVECVGGRRISGIGGHADFCAGASQSVGGVSVISLRAADPRGNSTIVPRVEVVSTPRSDVDVVVTEHGVADLRGCGEPERALRLIEIAAPEHRAMLHERNPS